MVYHAMDMRLNHFAAILDAVAVQTAATTVESEEGVEESVQEEEGGSPLHFRFRQLLCCVLCVCVCELQHLMCDLSSIFACLLCLLQFS